MRAVRAHSKKAAVIPPRRENGNRRKFSPHQSPAVTASPQGGSHTGGVPGRLLLPLGRGRGMPRPYRVVDFIDCNNRKLTPHPSPAVTASPQGEAIQAVCPAGWRWRTSLRAFLVWTEFRIDDRIKPEMVQSEMAVKTRVRTS